jgi:hypothetical protein
MTRERFWTLLSGVFGVSAISVLALALSAGDGRLRPELQSSVVAPISPPTRTGFDEEIDRLSRQVEALKNEITKLKEAREQTAQIIAALGAPEQDSADPATTYWYLQSVAFGSGIESEPEREDVIPIPRPPLQQCGMHRLHTARACHGSLRKDEWRFAASPGTPAPTRPANSR